jgi:hypothetical protein
MTGAGAQAPQVTNGPGEFEEMREKVMGHLPRHVTKAEIHRQIHGSSAVGRFNAWLAVNITRLVGTMWAAYVFTLLALISLPAAIDAFNSGQIIVAVSWLSQSLLQLVLLPIIIVGQNVISAAQDARAEADHETLTALHSINIHQLRILEQQQKILVLLGQSKAAEQGPPTA